MILKVRLFLFLTSTPYNLSYKGVLQPDRSDGVDYNGSMH